MRKVKTNNSAFPALLFAQGVEQLVAEKIQHPTKYDDLELKSRQRKETFAQPKTSDIQQSMIGLVPDLLKIIFGGKPKGYQS